MLSKSHRVAYKRSICPLSNNNNDGNGQFRRYYLQSKAYGGDMMRKLIIKLVVMCLTWDYGPVAINAFVLSFCVIIPPLKLIYVKRML